MDENYTCVSVYKINLCANELKKISKSILSDRKSLEFLDIYKESYECFWIHSSFWEYLNRTKIQQYGKLKFLLDKKSHSLPIIASPFFIIDTIDLIDAFDEQFDINVGGKYLKVSEDNDGNYYNLECPNYAFLIKALEDKINQKRFNIDWKSDFPNKLTSFRNALAEMISNIDYDNESILIYVYKLDFVPQHIYNNGKN